MNTSYLQVGRRIRFDDSISVSVPTQRHRIEFAEPLAPTGSLSGRVALLSGGLSIMAQSVAISLAQRGATIGILQEGRAQCAARLSESICSIGGRASIVEGNLADESACDALATRVFETFDAVDILIHVSDCRMVTPIHRLHRREWDTIVRDGLGSAYNLTRAFINPMRHRQAGRVIFLVEVPARTEPVPANTQQASECAIEGLARELAIENASRGITVNCVVAGNGADGVAPLVGFLASDDGAGISGQVIAINNVTPA